VALLTKLAEIKKKEREASVRRIDRRRKRREVRGRDAGYDCIALPEKE